MEHAILGLVGATGAGKTTLARQLTQHHGFVHLQVAQPLKEMLCVLGLAAEDVDGTPDQRAKSQPLLGGKSARYALSTLGTNWGRNMITPDLFANVMKLRIEKQLNHTSPSPIVIDDLRFPNDWMIVKHFGGLILTIRRPETERLRTPLDRLYYSKGLNRLMRGRGAFGWSPIHETEYHWPDAPSFAEIWNIGTIEELVAKAMVYCRGML